MKPTLRILTKDDVQQSISMPSAIEAVESAFAAHGRGETTMPPKVYIPLPEHDGDFRAMPAAWGALAGVKWVNCHPHNKQRHDLPSVLGLYILSDVETALPLALIDGTLLTALRTGAAAGVASKHLAPSARSLGLVGCGAQAGFFIAAHRALFPQIVVRVTDTNEEAAHRLATEHNVDVRSLAEVCNSDILCTGTPSRLPYVQRGWLAAGAHINAMGADAPGKRELEDGVIQDAQIYVDDWEQGVESGEINVPLREGTLQRKEIAGTLGELVAGTIPAPESSALTVFDSTGLAIQDSAVAAAIHDSARATGLGQEIALFGEL